MTRLAAVRAFALFDLVVTGLLALPWVADRVLALLLTWFGLDGSPGDCSFDPLMMAFVNLAGILGVLWNGRRYVAPTPEHRRWDMWGRVAVAVLLVFYVVFKDVPSVLLLFVVSELAGADAERRWLATRDA